MVNRMYKDKEFIMAKMSEVVLDTAQPRQDTRKKDITKLAEDILDETEDVEMWLKIVVESFPGLAQDMFLKRASLFFMMLFRRMVWFKHSIHKLPIPADYQIPKILESEGCIQYSSKLKNDITEGKLIPKGSLMECEIRAASIIACQQISQGCNVTMCAVDDYIWMHRKEYDMPFHLTITTDY